MLNFDIIDNVEDLSRLGPEWNCLWNRSPDGSYVNTHAYALHFWENYAGTLGRALVCVTGRENGRLVLVCPLMSYRRKAWTFLSPLSPTLFDFSNILAGDGPRHDTWIGAGLRFVLREAKADILDFPYVRDGDPLQQQLGELSRVSYRKPGPVPRVEWQEATSWSGYYNALSKTTRKVQDKKRRQLQALGDVTFTLVEQDHAKREALDFLFEQKRIWCRRVNKMGHWVFSDEYRAFLNRLCLDKTPELSVGVFTLRLNGQIIAVQVAGIHRQVDWLIAAYHDAFAQRSPGVILNEHCLRWAFERGLPVSMGVGPEANKTFWSQSGSQNTTSFKLAASVWGAPLLLFLSWRKRLLTRLRRA